MVAAPPADLHALKPMLAKQLTMAVPQADNGPKSKADAIFACKQQNDFGLHRPTYRMRLSNN
jgi:hypothetical protein